MSTKYSKEAFFALLSPIVVQVRREGSKILPSVRLAQNWLETGGKIHSWNNLGGYKVGSGKPTAYWDGSSVSTATWEVYNGVKVNTSANWRSYSSLYNFYKDQDLLFDKSRYDRVRAATTPEAQTAAVYACGYATDPAYASKLMSIIKANNLTRYDVQDGEEEDPVKIAELEKKLDAQNKVIVEQDERLKKLETRLNINGDQSYASSYAEAITAAKAAGAITNSADKSKPELNMIQMMFNMGLFKKGAK